MEGSPLLTILNVLEGCKKPEDVFQLDVGGMISAVVDYVQLSHFASLCRAMERGDGRKDEHGGDEDLPVESMTAEEVVEDYLYEMVHPNGSGRSVICALIGSGTTSLHSLLAWFTFSVQPSLKLETVFTFLRRSLAMIDREISSTKIKEIALLIVSAERYLHEGNCKAVVSVIGEELKDDRMKKVLVEARQISPSTAKLLRLGLILNMISVGVVIADVNENNQSVNDILSDILGGKGAKNGEQRLRWLCKNLREAEVWVQKWKDEVISMGGAERRGMMTRGLSFASALRNEQAVQTVLDTIETMCEDGRKGDIRDELLILLSMSRGRPPFPPAQDIVAKLQDPSLLILAVLIRGKLKEGSSMSTCRSAVELFLGVPVGDIAFKILDKGQHDTTFTYTQELLFQSVRMVSTRGLTSVVKDVVLNKLVEMEDLVTITASFIGGPASNKDKEVVLSAYLRGSTSSADDGDHDQSTIDLLSFLLKDVRGETRGSAENGASASKEGGEKGSNPAQNEERTRERKKARMEMEVEVVKIVPPSSARHLPSVDVENANHMQGPSNLESQNINIELGTSLVLSAVMISQQSRERAKHELSVSSPLTSLFEVRVMCEMLLAETVMKMGGVIDEESAKKVKEEFPAFSLPSSRLVEAEMEVVNRMVNSRLHQNKDMMDIRDPVLQQQVLDAFHSSPCFASIQFLFSSSTTRTLLFNLDELTAVISAFLPSSSLEVELWHAIIPKVFECGYCILHSRYAWLNLRGGDAAVLKELHQSLSEAYISALCFILSSLQKEEKDDISYDRARTHGHNMLSNGRNGGDWHVEMDTECEQDRGSDPFRLSLDQRKIAIVELEEECARVMSKALGTADEIKYFLTKCSCPLSCLPRIAYHIPDMHSAALPAVIGTVAVAKGDAVHLIYLVYFTRTCIVVSRDDAFKEAVSTICGAVEHYFASETIETNREEENAVELISSFCQLASAYADMSDRVLSFLKGLAMHKSDSVKKASNDGLISFLSSPE